jgi:two-component system LytT family sensor kinase
VVSASVRPFRVIAALLALSFAQYWLLYWITTYVEASQYYSLASHAALFGFCALGYAACWACDRALRTRRWLALALSYPLAGVVMGGWYAAVRWARDWPNTWAHLATSEPVLLLLFHSVIAGTYFAIRHIDAVSAQARAERAAAHAELRRLQQQVDPHFLFNNLNILTALIQQAPGDAEAFCRHLAQLYRHLLHHNQTDWVELDDELEFVEHYLHLLTARFGRAYRVSLAVPRGSRYVVIPGALQELLGNMVKHNHASEAEPIDLELRLEPRRDGDALVADSAHRPRRGGDPVSQRGLALLVERYRLQTGRAVSWARCDGRFVVELPLVTAR